MRWLLVVGGSVLVGLGLGYLLFGGARPAVEPACPQLTAPARAPAVISGEPAPSQLRRPAVEAAPVAAAPAGSDAVPPGTSVAEALRAQLEFERESHTAARGERPVEPPPGLPARFSDEKALAAMWKERLRGTRFSATEPVVKCDEYPCYVTLSGVGPEQLGEVLGAGAPAPYEGAQETAVAWGGNAGDGGGPAWQAGIALFPPEEPAARKSQIDARLGYRFFGHAVPARP